MWDFCFLQQGILRFRLFRHSAVPPFHTFPFHCSPFTVPSSVNWKYGILRLARKKNRKNRTLVSKIKRRAHACLHFLKFFLVNITNKIICIHYASSMSLLFVILRSHKYTFIIHRWFKYFIRYPFFSIYDETGSVLNRIDLDVSSASFNNHQK